MLGSLYGTRAQSKNQSNGNGNDNDNDNSSCSKKLRADPSLQLLLVRFSLCLGFSALVP
jgi:hypothetical protein